MKHVRHVLKATPRAYDREVAGREHSHSPEYAGTSLSSLETMMTRNAVSEHPWLSSLRHLPWSRRVLSRSWRAYLLVYRPRCPLLYVVGPLGRVAIFVDEANQVSGLSRLLRQNETYLSDGRP